MNRYLIILLFTLSPFLQAEEMKCAPGKCGAAMDIPSKADEILPAIKNNTSLSEMKCAPGKCGASMETSSKSIPEKNESQQDITQSTSVENENEKTPGITPPTIKQLFNVTTVKVNRDSIAPQKNYYGYVVADDALLTDVVVRYSGYVELLYANQTYQRVNKGQALAKVYSPEVYKAKQEYLNALRFSDTHPSKEMIKSSKDKLELLGINDKEIADIEKNRRVDTTTTIYAPVSGWMIEKKLNNGSSFAVMHTLFTIVNLEQVWVEMKLYQDDMGSLEELQHFAVQIKGLNRTFQAKKSLLYPLLDPKESTATLRLTLPNPEGVLRPGMYASIYASSSQSSQLVIPRTAAIRKNGEWYAFLATQFKGEYEPVKIELEPLDNRYFIVKQGLYEGDSVVNNALFMMDSDAQINSIY